MIKFFKDIKKYFNYIFYSAKTTLKSEVANSYLNWLWWILEPLCFMVIYALVFTFFFKGNIKHLSPFIFIGITFWDFFSRMLKNSVKLVRSNKTIVSKVYIPKYALVLEKLAVNMFKTSISFAIIIALMIVTKVPFTFHVLWSVLLIASLLIFVFGLSTIFMHFGVYVDDLSNITEIFLRLMFYMTGVFYNLGDKAIGNLGFVLVHFNPMAFYINAFRDSLLYGKMPELLWLLGWTAVGVLLSVVGITLVQKNENNYVKVI